MNETNFLPSLFDISNDGIRIPAPEPSSDMTTESISSSELSITTATATPAYSIFLTFYTNEHPPLSAIINGVKNGSSSSSSS